MKLVASTMDTSKGLLEVLNQALMNDSISYETAGKIKVDIAKMLYRQASDFSGNQSNSLQIERVSQLSASWLYTIDLYIDTVLKDDFLNTLRTTSIENIYKDAYTFIQIYQHETELLYSRLQSKRISLNIDIYNETFEKALPLLFEGYNFKYDAEDLVSDIDYPLVFDKMDMKGIRYIRNYLNLFSLENEACMYFETGEIVRLLNAHSKRHGIELKDLPTNIFEPIIRNHFFKLAAGGSVTNLILIPSEVASLHETVNILNKDGILRSLNELKREYKSKTPFWDKNVQEYVINYIDSMIHSWAVAIHSGYFRNLLIADD